MTDDYDKVSDAISDDQLAHSEQETGLQELRDRIAHLETPQGAAERVISHLHGSPAYTGVIQGIAEREGILYALRTIAGEAGE